LPDVWRASVSIRGLLQAAAVLTILFSWATLFGSAHRYLDLFSHFRIQYLLATIVLLLAFLVMRRRVEIVALVLTLLLNASQVVPWYGMPGANAVVGTPAFSLLLANVHTENDRYHELLALVDEAQPDVIVLQELTPAWLAFVEPALVDYVHRLAIPRDDPFGIGIFSRIPMPSVGAVENPPLGLPTLVATIQVSGRPLTLVATHPMPPIGRDGIDARNEQLRGIAGLVTDSRADVLVGDLNTTMWSATYRGLVDATGLRNSRRGFGTLPSWPTFLPITMIPLDHCLVSDRIDVVETTLGAHIGSDHRPLLVRLAWREAGDAR
jgi:endonuclease/exonuclease/phosphatase (EEP) superfamily protein YafD